jgi:hypothetical protein
MLEGIGELPENQRGVLMLRVRITGALLVSALLAIAGTAASSASAETFTLTATKCTGGIFINYCYENTAKEKLELTGNQTIGIALLRETTWHLILPFRFGGAILCRTVIAVESKVAQTAPLSEDQKLKRTLLRFSECKFDAEIEIEKECKVSAEFESLPLVGSPTSGTELVIKPETGTTIMEFTIENNGAEKCPATIKGKHALTGEQAFTYENPGTAEEAKTIKSVKKSKLKVGEEAAELEVSLVMSFTGLGDRIYLSSES